MNTILKKIINVRYLG